MPGCHAAVTTLQENAHRYVIGDRLPLPMHEPSYGSDPSGLICGYLFGAGGEGRTLTSAEAERWLKAGTAPDSGDFIWLHFNLSNAGSERWMRQHLVLSEAFHEALHEGTRSTRIDHVDDTLVAIVNDVLFDFSFDATDISTDYSA